MLVMLTATLGVSSLEKMLTGKDVLRVGKEKIKAGQEKKKSRKKRIKKSWRHN